VGRRIAIVALLWVVLPAARARAQALPGSIEIGAGGGRFYGGSFAKGTTRAFSRKIEVDDDIAAGFFPNEPRAGTIDIATIDALAVLSFPHGNFVPYAAFGGGITNLDINVPDRNVRDVNRFGASAAVGAKFFAARWLGFRIDARFRATYLGTRSVEDGGWTDTNRWFRNSEIFGGVFFSFGGTPGS
jgi:hypothetical protein